MQNTADDVVISRKLAHQLKALLMDIEQYWFRKNDTPRFERASAMAKELISHEKPGSTPASQADIDDMGDLLPDCIEETLSTPRGAD